MVIGTKWRGLAALAAALALSTSSSAMAADLGGDCCADLEERIAELEATTARKGNRKVSLEIGGQVNEALMFWDDGVESNVYQVTSDDARTRFRFKGKAKINADWEAGYAIEVGIRTARSNRVNQINDDAGEGPDLRDSYWFLKSKTYGGVSVGMQGTATDQITETNFSQTKDFAKLSDMEDHGLSMLLRNADTGALASGAGSSSLAFRNLLGGDGDQPGDGDRRSNVVKYETPEFAGFAAQVAWGEDDVWDVALRYAGEMHGVKIAAGIGYGESTDGSYVGIDCVGGLAAAGSDKKCNNFGGSIMAMHVDTGLYVGFGAGVKTDDLMDDNPTFAGVSPDDDQEFWSLQAGLERKFIALGKTTIYGEYYNYEGGSSGTQSVAAGTGLNPGGPDAQVWSTGLESYGFGIAQGIDAAAMVLYLSYRHTEADLELRDLAGVVANGAINSVDLEDLDVIMTGGIIRF
jgi:predicted porin